MPSQHKKPRGRNAANPGGQNEPGTGPTGASDQRKIRNYGTNRPQSKSDHMRRGDQRDRQPQK